MSLVATSRQQPYGSMAAMPSAGASQQPNFNQMQNQNTRAMAMAPVLPRPASGAAATTPSKPQAQGSPATSTPAQQSPSPTTPLGRWRHPKLDEVERRKAAVTFGSQNLRVLAISGACLASTVMLPSFIPIAFRSSVASVPYLSLFATIIQVLLITQMALQFLPFYRRQNDSIEDIPLTPGQRKLLGLPPSAGGSATPGSPYITPPRVQRTTPRSASTGGPDSTGREMYTAHSPSYSPTGGSSSLPRNGSPYSASGNSPLVRKAMEGRRMSGSRNSPLGFGASGSVINGTNLPSGSVFDAGLSTGSPGRGRNATVGLSNKWLYQRRRESGGLYT